MTHDPGVSSVVSGFCAFDTCLIIYYIFILMTKFILVTTGKCVFFSDDVASRGIEPASIPACSLSTHEIGSMFK